MARSWSWLSGHTSSTRPSLAASCAGISSPVNRYCLARCHPSRCTHKGFVGTPHTRAGGYPNDALSEATIRSAQKTISVPPPTHHPWTAAIVGFDEYQSLAKAETKVEILRRSYIESQTRPPGPCPACCWA